MKKNLIVLLCGLFLGAAANTVTAQNSGTTGPLAWEFANGTLTITGNGAMPNYTESNVPWLHLLSSTLTVNIGEGVTGIGNYAFNDGTKLTSVTIPETVTSIGNSAFAYCFVLPSITLPESLETIGSFAFNNCIHLTSIVIPDLVTDIKERTFNYCPGLTSVTLPQSLETIGAFAFSECTSLNGVTLPESLVLIHDNAFQYCRALTSIVIPNQITSIRDNVFYSCHSLTSVTIPQSVTSIGTAAFYGCRGLISITLPQSITTINTYAFSACWNLAEVVNHAVVPQTIVAQVFWELHIDSLALLVPAASVDAYSAAGVWQDFKSIEAITDIPVTGVSLNMETLTLKVNSTETLKATIAPADATNKNVTWSSSNPAVATVDETGVVTALSAGTATITVTTEEGGFTATCTVTAENNAGIGDSTFSGITVYGNGNNVYIVNKNSVNLKSIQIIDVSGRLVYDRDAINRAITEEIPVNGGGIYVVKLVSDNNRELTKKVYLSK